MLLLLAIKLFKTEVVYCDDGSINSANILLDRFDVQRTTNDQNTKNFGCFSAFDHYQHILKRRLY